MNSIDSFVNTLKVALKASGDGFEGHYVENRHTLFSYTRGHDIAIVHAAGRRGGGWRLGRRRTPGSWARARRN